MNPGNNPIRRRSIDSSVTIPYERTFRSQAARPGDPGSASAAEFDFCGCGWPHHMLVPKGTQQGYPMVLFAMVSNWDEDRVSYYQCSSSLRPSLRMRILMSSSTADHSLPSQFPHLIRYVSLNIVRRTAADGLGTYKKMVLEWKP